MSIQFKGPAVLVKDMERSKKFYETILGQKIEMDFGENISFVGGFSIWQGDHANTVIFNDKREYVSTANKSFELYFETVDLDTALSTVNKYKAHVLHDIREYPWGQRGFRVYDPDGHIVEIAEPLDFVVKRFNDKGLSVNEITEKTSVPEEVVKAMLGI